MAAVKRSSFAGALAVAISFATAAAVFSQQKPIFRAGVELLAIDVTVVDERGGAVRDLTPDDFVVEIAGQRRPVVRSDFIDFSDRGTPGSTAASEEVASNQASAHVPDPRFILLLVDDESFTVTEGRSAFMKLADSMEHAFPGDALGFAALSGRAPIVEFTTDRRPVIETLRGLLGRRFYAGTQTDIAMVEAIDIARGNTFALDRTVERECSALPASTTAALAPGASVGQSGVSSDPCRRAVWADAIAVTTAMHAQTQRTLAALARHLDRLGRLPGVKYVLLVSQGIVLDEDVGITEELARVAKAATVTLQVLHVDRQDPGDVARAHPAPRAPEDARLRAVGLDSVAAAAGGNVEHAITEARAAFERIGRQIATVYRLGVEMTEEDTRGGGGTRPIVVTTTRPGVTVHTYRQVLVPERLGVATMTGLEGVLESPAIDRGIPMRMAAFGFRSAERGGNIVVSAEADAPVKGLRVAYSVRDHLGRAIVATELSPGAIVSAPGAPALIVFRTTAPLGDYTVKLAVVDSDGRTGSVVQSVILPRADARGFALGDLIVLPPGVDVLHSRPSAHIARGTREAGVYFELYSTGPMPAEFATLNLEVRDAKSGASVGSTREPVALTKVPGYAEIAGRIRFSPAPLAPGDYVVRLTVEGTSVTGSRRFTVD